MTTQAAIRSDVGSPELDAGISDAQAPSHTGASDVAIAQKSSTLSDAGLKKVAVTPGMVLIRGGELKEGLSPEGMRIVRNECRRLKLNRTRICRDLEDEGTRYGQRVRLSTFLLDKYEVSFDDYQECVKAGVCRSPKHKFNGFGYPVTGVTFADAKTFCRWQKKRLPTRLEWAFAVRGENVEDLFPWGHSFSFFANE